MLNTFRVSPPGLLDALLRVDGESAELPEQAPPAMLALAHRFIIEHELMNRGSIAEMINLANSPEVPPTWDAFYASSQLQTAIKNAAQSSVVGITVPYAEQVWHALLIAKLIKTKNDNAKIVLGGPQITLAAKADRELLLREDHIDFLILYDGQKPLHDLVLQLRGTAEQSLAGVPNLCFQDGSTSSYTETAVYNAHPDEAETPEYDDHDVDRCFQLSGDEPYLTVLVSAGCYWGKCVFCDYVHLLPDGSPRHLERSASMVADDVVKLQSRHRVKLFALSTDSVPPRWVKAFVPEVKKRRIHVSFDMFIKNHPKRLYTVEFLESMLSGGLDRVTIGVEATSDRVLDVVKKGSKQEFILDNFYMMLMAGINPIANLIPDFPTTTFDEAKGSVEFLLNNRDAFAVLNPASFDLSINSEIADEPEKYGLRISNSNRVSARNAGHALTFERVEGMTEDERTRAVVAVMTLMEELKLYHATVRNRERIDANGFCWEKAVFSFCSFIEIPSTISLREGSTERPTQFLIPIGGPECVFEIGVEFKNIVKLMHEGYGVRNSFESVMEALRADYNEQGRDRSLESLRKECAALLRSLVYNGFISDVFGGASFSPGPLVREMVGEEQAGQTDDRFLSIGLAADPVRLAELIQRQCSSPQLPSTGGSCGPSGEDEQLKDGFLPVVS